jgi:regulator of RNase E activity RraA
LEVNVPVTLAGLDVKPGDLLHGDVNGLLVIPESVADRAVEQALKVRAAEAEVLEFLKKPGLTVEALRRFQERFTH